MTYDMAFVARLLRLLDEYEQHEDLFWRTGKRYGGGEFASPASFFISVNDVFYWGCADGVEITPDNVGVMERALADSKAACEHGEIWGTMLFAARVRQMRPQGAAYPSEQGLWPLFDDCGPERPVGPGNPHPHPSKVKRGDDQ